MLSPLFSCAPRAPRRALRFAVLALAPLLAPACSNDSAGGGDTSSGAICGNGIVEGTESCDVDSPGCVSCAVAPNWTCQASGCTPVCGDGVVGSDASCADAHRAEPCNMTGYWATRETNFSRDAVISSVQTSSAWFLFRLEQEGDSFRVAEELDCGVHVTGSVTVDSSDGTLRSSLYLNRMDGGDGARPARRGVSKASGAGCEVSLERWYDVRGAATSYLPADFGAKPELSSLPPLPTVTDPVNGTEVPQGSEDPDADGIPGTAFVITGSFASGTRNSAQRDWREYQTDPATPAPAGALNFTIPGRFDLEENVLRVTDCGSTCALLASTANAAKDLPGRVTFSFIGRTLGTPRVDAVVTGPPRANLDADLATCAKVRELLPHDAAQQ